MMTRGSRGANCLYWRGALAQSGPCNGGFPCFVADRTVYERFRRRICEWECHADVSAGRGAGCAAHYQRHDLRSAHGRSAGKLGGFASVKESLTDDYAMAQLYARAGRRVFAGGPCLWRVAMDHCPMLGTAGE